MLPMLPVPPAAPPLPARSSRTWGTTAIEGGPQAVELGLASSTDLETMARAWRQWGGSEDAWFVVVHGEVLARV